MKALSRSALCLVPALAGTAAAQAPLKLEPFTVPVGGGRTLRAERGFLTVPEVRSRKDSRTLELAVVRLLGSSAKPQPPLIYLHGGPGGSATQGVRDPEAMAAWAPFLDLGDLVLLDQRGCGMSRPSLAPRLATPLARDAFLSAPAMGKALLALCQEQRQLLAKENVDVAGYTTEENADDVDALRAALGAERMRILGFSYGSHLGLSVVRRHGPRVAEAILVGVEGPDHTFKLPSNYDTLLHKVSLLVSRDPRIGTQMPDMAGLLRRVLAQLAEKPLVVTVRDPATRQDVELPIGPFGLQLILRMDLGDTTDLVVFPRLLHTVAKGDGSVLQWFAAKRFAQLMRPSALWFTMDPASGCSPERAARIARESKACVLGNAMNLDFPEVDALWRMPVLGEHFRTPIVTEVRTLFLTGTLDANTPPWQAEELRWGFARSTHLIQEHAGHEDWLRNAKVMPVLLRFLRGDEVRGVDLDMPPLRFMVLEGKDELVRHPSVMG